MQNLGTMKVKVKYDFGLGGNLLLASGAVAVGVYAIKKIVELDSAIKANKGLSKAKEAIDYMDELVRKVKFANEKESEEENTEDAKQEAEESI